MATPTREEISIRLGVDSRAAISGLERIQTQITKFSNDATKKLGSIFKANVFMAATQLATELIPSWQELWDKFYGTDPETMQKSEDANDRISSWGKRVRDARQKFIDTVKESEYDIASPLDKQAIIQSDLNKNNKEIETLRARVNLLKDVRADVEKISEAQEKLNTALTENVKLGDKLRKLRESFTPQEMAEDYRRRYKAENDEVYRNRREIRNITEEMQSFAEEGDFGEGYQRLNKQREAIMQRNREITFRRRADVASNLPDWEMFKPFKDFYDPASSAGMKQFEFSKYQQAQQEAMKEALNNSVVQVVLTQIALTK